MAANAAVLSAPTRELKGLVIVITGASTGIGAEAARQACAAGAILVLAARRQKELESVAAACPGSLAIVADVTRREDVEHVAAEAIARFGHFDVWVNNVGKGISRPPTQLDPSDIDEMIDVNVKSALHGMQVATAHFKERGCGQVVNISSALGRVPSVMPRAAYSAAKHYLNSLTANFRQEVGETHPRVTFTIVSPGLVYTEFGSNALHGGIDSRKLRGKAPGQEEDAVARVIMYAIRAQTPDVYTAAGHKKVMLDYLGALAHDPPADDDEAGANVTTPQHPPLVAVARRAAQERPALLCFGAGVVAGALLSRALR